MAENKDKKKNFHSVVSGYIDYVPKDYNAFVSALKSDPALADRLYSDLVKLEAQGYVNSVPAPNDIRTIFTGQTTPTTTTETEVVAEEETPQQGTPARTFPTPQQLKQPVTNQPLPNVGVQPQTNQPRPTATETQIAPIDQQAGQVQGGQPISGDVLANAPRQEFQWSGQAPTKPVVQPQTGMPQTPEQGMQQGGINPADLAVSTLGSAETSLISQIGSELKGIAETGYSLDKKIVSALEGTPFEGGYVAPYSKPEDSWIYQAGQGLQNFTEEYLYRNPEYAGGILDVIAQGTGSVGAIALTGGLSPAGGVMKLGTKAMTNPQLIAYGASQLFKAPMIRGAFAMVGQETDSARQLHRMANQMDKDAYVVERMALGEDKEDAGKAWETLRTKTEDEVAESMILPGVFAGVTEAIPLERLLVRLGKPAQNIVLNAFKQGGIQGAEEATQEVIQQTIINAGIGNTYNEAQKLTTGLMESAEGGGATGFVLGAVLTALVGKRANIKQRVQAGEITPQEAIAEMEDINKAEKLVQDKLEGLSHMVDSKVVEEVAKVTQLPEAETFFESNEASLTNPLVTMPKEVESVFDKIADGILVSPESLHTAYQWVNDNFKGIMQNKALSDAEKGATLNIFNGMLSDIDRANTEGQRFVEQVEEVSVQDRVPAVREGVKPLPQGQAPKGTATPSISQAKAIREENKRKQAGTTTLPSSGETIITPAPATEAEVVPEVTTEETVTAEPSSTDAPVSLETAKPEPKKVKVLGKEMNIYNNYIPSKAEDIESDAIYSFNAPTKEGLPAGLHDVAYVNTTEVNGVKLENWNASISGEELLKQYLVTPTAKTQSDGSNPELVQAVEQLLTPTQDAVQKQTAGQVPVQSGTTSSQEVAKGEPQAEPQSTADKGQAQATATQEEVGATPTAETTTTTTETAGQEGGQVVYHATKNKFDDFDESFLGSNTGAQSAKEGFFFATNPDVAISYASKANEEWSNLKKKADEANKRIEDILGFDSREYNRLKSKHYRINLGENEAEINRNQKIIDDALKDIGEFYLYDDAFQNEPIWNDNSLSENAELKEVVLDMKNPFVYDFKGEQYREKTYSEIIKKAKEEGYDSVIFKNTYDGNNPYSQNIKTDIHVVFKSSQIKNAKKESSQESKPITPINATDVETITKIENATEKGRELALNKPTNKGLKRAFEAFKDLSDRARKAGIYDGKTLKIGGQEIEVDTPAKFKAFLANQGNFDALSEAVKGVESEQKTDTNPSPKTVEEKSKEVFNDAKSTFVFPIGLNPKFKFDSRLPENVVRFFKKYFRPRGLWTKGMFSAKRGMENQISAQQKRTEFAVKDLKQAVNEAYPKGITNEQLSAINDTLQGYARELPANLYRPIEKMREHIDELSRLMISEGIIDERLVPVFDANMGIYTTRTYAIHNDPEKWIRYINEQPEGQQIRNNAVNFVRQATEAKADRLDRFADENEIRAEKLFRRSELAEGDEALMLQAKADEVIARADKQRELARTMREQDFDAQIDAFLFAEGQPLDIVRKGNVGAKDLGVLKKRKNIPDEFRALMGEEKDPLTNYTMSVAKMSALIANNQFLNEVKAQGLASGLFSKQTPQGKNVVKIASASTDSMSPLNGIYTTKDIAEAFKEFDANTKNPWYVDAMLWVNAVVKIDKTVLSEQAVVRNFLGNPIVELANGYIPTFKGRAINTQMEEILNRRFGDRADVRGYIERLTKLGVLGQGGNYREIQAIYEDLKGKNYDYQKLIEPALKKAGKATWNVLQKIYKGGDEFWKVVAFENERAVFKKAYGDTKTDEELDEMTATKIRRTRVDYSMAPKAVKVVNKFPFAGTFVTFPAEIIRIGANIPFVAYEEMNSGNKVLRDHGIKRMAGYMTAMTLSYGLSELTRYLAGMDDEEEEARKQFLAPWTQNSTLVWIDKNTYVDTGFSDAFSILKKPIVGFIRGADFVDGSIQAVKEFLGPLISEEIGYKTYESVKNNRDEYDNPIYDENAEYGTKVSQIASYVLKKVEPGTVSQIRRLYLGETGALSEKGQKYSTTDEITNATFGIKRVTVDWPNAVSFKFRDGVEKINNSNKFFLKATKELRKNDVEGRRKAAESTNLSIENNYNDLRKYYTSALKIGMLPKNVEDIMRESGLSNELINAVVNNTGYNNYLLILNDGTVLDRQAQKQLKIKR